MKYPKVIPSVEGVTKTIMPDGYTGKDFINWANEVLPYRDFTNWSNNFFTTANKAYRDKPKEPPIHSEIEDSEGRKRRMVDAALEMANN